MTNRVLLVALLLLGVPTYASAQSVRVRDLTINAGAAPVRLAGYGLVVGLSGTGDRVYGGSRGTATVRTVANLLRNLGVEVPESVIRSRNVAAVLVTAEASPFTRAGGQFDVSVASLGDATSLRGGQLWPAPLRAGVGGPPVAVAQGNVFLVQPTNNNRFEVETSAVVRDAAIAQVDFGGGAAGPPGHLLLRDPDLSTAQTIAEAINQALGTDVATVEDPGAIALALPADDPIATLVALGDVEVTPTQAPRVVVDARSGVVAVGGDISVGPATVSHDWLTLTIAPADGPPPAGPLGAGGQEVLTPGAVRAEPGIRVQSLAEALHSVGASADMIGMVFRSLNDLGALRAEVQVR